MKWLRDGVENKERISLSSGRKAGVAILTVKNVSRNDAGIYTCRKSNTLEHFYLNVIGKQAANILQRTLSLIQYICMNSVLQFDRTNKLFRFLVPSIRFSNGSLIFIRTNGTVDLTCTTTSVKSVDEIAWKLNNTSIEPEQTIWRTKARKCLTKERENCIIETTFGLKIENVRLSDTGNYTCSTASHKIVPASIYVQVIDSEYLNPFNIFCHFAGDFFRSHNYCQGKYA